MPAAPTGLGGAAGTVVAGRPEDDADCVVRAALAAGAAPPELELTLGHRSFFWGRAVRGIVEGDSNPQLFIPALVELHARGRFPLERLVSFYPLHEINRAAAQAEDGVIVKPVLRPPPD